MFIRVKTKPGNLRKTAQVVESVRDGRKTGQHIVRHIGVARNREERRGMTGFQKACGPYAASRGSTACCRPGRVARRARRCST